MLLPTKRISQERSLLVIGAGVLRLLNESKTVSRLWEEVRNQANDKGDTQAVTYSWFILTLDFLYVIGAVDIDHGHIRKLRK